MDFDVQPVGESREIVEQDVLSTAPVEADSSVVSFRNYSFDKRSKSVVRRKSRKTNETIIWSSASNKPDVQMMDSASAMGAFAVMTISNAEETHKEMESLHAQLVDSWNNLQREEDRI